MEVKKLKFNRKDIKIEVQKETGILTVAGAVGSCRKVFKGADIRLLDNGVFIYSKNGLRHFLGLLKQMIHGVSEGFFVELRCVGLGYRVILLNNYVVFKLGFSHYIRCEYKDNVRFVGHKDKILIYGLDLQEVMRIGNLFRQLRKPDPYKGKGIRYSTEVVKLKVGKQK